MHNPTAPEALTSAQREHFSSSELCGNCKQPKNDHGFLTGGCPAGDVVLLDETTTFRPATDAERALWDVPSRT